MTDSSSLTFLKGSSDGTVGSSQGTVASSDKTASASDGTVRSSHGTLAGAGGTETTRKSRQPSDDDDTRLPLLVETEGDAGKNASLETIRRSQAGVGQEEGKGTGARTEGGRGAVVVVVVCCYCCFVEFR